MKKFFTGLKYGTWATRLYVISIPAVFLIGVGAIIVSFILNIMLLFLAGVAAMIGSITLILNYSIEESVVDGEEPEPPQSRKAEPEPLQSRKAEPEPSPDKKKETTPQDISADKGKKENTERDALKRSEELLRYDEKKVKQVFYKYKVKKDHKNIMIDAWKDKGIRQTPAYIWVVRGQIHILTIGEDVQEYTMPLTKAGKLMYQRGVICQAKEEYIQFRKESLLSAVFSPYLPVYHEGSKNHRPVIYKNLFAFENGLTVTNTSVKVIINMMHPLIEIDDIVMRDVRYNDFFKEIYKLGVLLREQVYSVREYQNLVNEILQSFAESGVTKEEYENTLQALYQNKLITEEYIQFYGKYWGQRQGQFSGDVGKRKRKRNKGNRHRKR